MFVFFLFCGGFGIAMMLEWLGLGLVGVCFVFVVGLLILVVCWLVGLLFVMLGVCCLIVLWGLGCLLIVMFGCWVLVVLLDDGLYDIYVCLVVITRC